ncbi:cytochrome c oxidase subunit II [Pseudogracilibacillus auburnensis]|uniref:Cytochrome c oxidase subunit 2 n=1 Tax=Pseudogracilibacillus auburnensis TaxID=1494959 RepID=A0A2V3W7U5_9BACI|nr:cytochrome c oxidase subunit II [Pseudogracilibacillus auburnensis]MBO1003545.1 cytochrome c oxidase subunit II [Pseudogracilibacillus auburnensis]PXW89234.1 cytochrome c oxidase subunit 2 [Pseudogracilibacillus auburnensis]
MKGWMGKLRTLVLLGSLAFILSGCGRDNLTALVPKGYGADVSMQLIILTTVVMTFVFLVVMVIYVIVLMRYRKKKGDPVINPEQVEGNKTLEAVWTIIPIILVVIMAVPTVFATFHLADDSDSEDHINIDVTGNQYWWHYDYRNEEIATSQDLYIPVNTKVYVHLITNDVLHSFWVPSLSGKLDVNPENVNTMYIEAYEEGVYFGKCAELCGPSHSLMDFKVVVVSEEEYDQWVQDMQNFDTETLDLDPVAQEGRELFEEKSCVQCHATDTQNYSAGSVPIGPDLTQFADRSRLAGYLDPTKENLVKWIQDPESLKPGNLMTGAYPELSDDEADKIAEYLLQLKPSEITAESKED